MKNLLILILILVNTFNSIAQELNYNGENFEIETVQVTHNEELALTVWTIKVKGVAGETTPVKVGQLDGAPVLGYVFPTNGSNRRWF